MTPITDYITPAPKLSELLKLQIQLGGSDLHLIANNKPRIRIHGNLDPLEDYEPLTAETNREYADSILNETQAEVLKTQLQVDFSISIPGLARFRVNACDQRGGLGLVFRAIPYEIMPFDKLGIPQVMVELCSRSHGLVLITGPTGSGKSTTCAAFIDKINRERAGKILTLEDPVEYLHSSKRSLVTQREVFKNTLSFESGSKNLVREDPDTVLIGELRDLSTIEEALRTAEKGHLTFATLHTNTAPSTITRIIHQIKAAMATGQDKHQMVTMNQSLVRLIAEGIVSLEDAALRSPDVSDLRERLGNFKTTQHTRLAPAAQPQRRVS
jgi:twitching motility protein PilT